MPTPTTLVVDQGNSQTAQINTTFGNVVGCRLYDEFGNWMPGVSITFNAGGPFSPFPGGVFTGPNPLIVVTGGDGRAVSSAMFANSEVGAWSGQIFVTGTPAVATTFSATNTPHSTTPVLTTLSFQANNEQLAARNTAYQAVSVLCRDQFGAAFAGGSVTMTCPAGRGTFSTGNSNTVASDGSGIATFAVYTASATLGTFNPSIAGSGTNTLVCTFTTIDPTVVAALTTYSGNNQFAAPSFPYAQPIIARAINAVNTPMAGVSVTFTAPASGASIVWTLPATNPVVVITDVNGLATSPSFAANATAGTFFVNATTPGAVSAYFQLTNGGSPPADTGSALAICEV